MIDKQKAFTDAINAIVKLDFVQCLTLQASLSEHLFNIWQNAQIKKELENANPDSNSTNN